MAGDGLMSVRVLGLLVAIGAAATLGVAFASEWWGGLVPCALCLVERWPWRVAIGLGLVGAVLPGGLGRAVLWLTVPVMMLGVGLGVVHVGVEHGAWPSPLPECAAPRITGTTMSERLRQLPALPSKPCEDPTYLIPAIPLSMSAANGLASLALGAGVAICLLRKQRRLR